ncbi:MAG TPA: hypothetical protein GX405_18670 [Rhizobiales bacterium]|nr:hypothetical protein [Hyphomicrobiales bacterium]
MTDLVRTVLVNISGEGILASAAALAIPVSEAGRPAGPLDDRDLLIDPVPIGPAM